MSQRRWPNPHRRSDAQQQKAPDVPWLLFLSGEGPDTIKKRASRPVGEIARGTTS
jgi:hypothetical protein